MSLQYELSFIKQNYTAIFMQAKTVLFEMLEGLANQFHCPQCEGQPDLLSPLHPGCGYRGWQNAALKTVQQDIAKEILQQLQAIEAYKKQFQCSQCGVCCRLASSEFTYDELLAKAKAGDYFVQQFTSIFLPYASTEAARKKFPELVDQVLAMATEYAPGKLPAEQAVHFYHCPYVGEDNRCTIYGTEKRPAICESYPDTPLTFIYEKCAWKPWKDETHQEALMAHASIELCLFVQDKLTACLASDASEVPQD